MCAAGGPMRRLVAGDNLEMNNRVKFWVEWRV